MSLTSLPLKLALFRFVRLARGPMLTIWLEFIASCSIFVRPFRKSMLLTPMPLMPRVVRFVSPAIGLASAIGLNPSSKDVMFVRLVIGSMSLT